MFHDHLQATVPFFFFLPFSLSLVCPGSYQHLLFSCPPPEPPLHLPRRVVSACWALNWMQTFRTEREKNTQTSQILQSISLRTLKLYVHKQEKGREHALRRDYSMPFVRTVVYGPGQWGGGWEGSILGREPTNLLPVLASWLCDKLWDAELLCPLRKK